MPLLSMREVSIGIGSGQVSWILLPLPSP